MPRNRRRAVHGTRSPRRRRIPSHDGVRADTGRVWNLRDGSGTGVSLAGPPRTAGRFSSPRTRYANWYRLGLWPPRDAETLIIMYWTRAGQRAGGSFGARETGQTTCQPGAACGKWGNPRRRRMGSNPVAPTRSSHRPGRAEWCEGCRGAFDAVSGGPTDARPALRAASGGTVLRYFWQAGSYHGYIT